MTTDTASTFDAGDMMQVVGFDMTQSRGQQGLRGGRHRAGGCRRRRAARLLRAQRADHLRGARALSRRRRGEVHRRWRQHLRRQVRHQSLRRPAVEGPPARRDRPCAMLRADASIARHRRRDARSRRATGVAAQSRSRRRLRRDPVRTRVRTDMVDQSAVGRSFTPVTAHVEPGGCVTSSRRSASAIRSTAMRGRARQSGYSAMPVPPTYLFCLEMMDSEQSVRIPDRARRSILPACCTANSASSTALPSWSATR